MRVVNPWRSLGGLPRDVWVLFVVSLVNRAGTMVMPFLALYIAETNGLGFGASVAGGVIMAYGAVALVMGPIAGRLADRFGAVNVMKASLIGSAAVLALFPFARSLPALVAVTLAWALAAELLRPAALAIAADAAPPEQRRASFAVSRLAVNLGMSIGPVAGGFLAEISYSFLFYVDAATSLAAAGLLFLLPLELRWAAPREVARRAPDTPGRTWVSDTRLLWVLAASLPTALVFFQLIAALPLYMKRELAMGESVVGMVFAVNTVLIVLTEVPLNAAMSRWSHRKSMATGAIFTAVGYGALAFAVGPVTTAMTVVLWTVGEMILFPSLSAYVSELSPAEQRGRYMGLYAMNFSLAFAIGPWIGTRLLETIGGPALWLLCLGVGLLSAVMFLRVKGAPPGTHAEASSV